MSSENRKFYFFLFSHVIIFKCLFHQLSHKLLEDKVSILCHVFYAHIFTDFITNYVIVSLRNLAINMYVNAIFGKGAIVFQDR
jgi:hypothetical protein